MSLPAVLDFVDSGHDLIIAADESDSDFIKSIATECGVDFEEDPSAVVIHHKSYDVSKTDGDHTLIASSEFIEYHIILGKTKIEVSSSVFSVHLRVGNFVLISSCCRFQLLISWPVIIHV